MTDSSHVRIHYRRPPDREQVFHQIVVLERKEVIVTLAESIDLDVPMIIEGQIALEPGSSVVWFTFPGAWHDIGSFHRKDSSFTGFYANVITPPRIEDHIWHTTDLYLDVWVTPNGTAKLLDEDEFEEAVAHGLLDYDTAIRAREEANNLLEEARGGVWPPPIVREWTLAQARASAIARSVV